MPPDESIAALNAALTGRYEVIRELGAGGMATVYLAQDRRHDRKVALKVLRPELAAVVGADRFLAEIKTTANLQHPHILALFDSGEVGGSVFYVMPFVDGESLRDRLNREAQLPLEDALRIAREVGDALEYAHAHGVIHRDIKPENIMLQGGHALVADFGIALAASKTGGTRMTETGMSLGTPTYMSPEQAMGERTIDARTDVYALGCVLFEMLAGEAPFTGPTAQSIVGKVLTDKPRALRSLRASVPVHVEGAVRHALEKLPADRFSSAAEFVRALSGTSSHTWQESHVAVVVTRPVRVTLIAALALAAIAVAFVAGRRTAPNAAASAVPSRLAILAPTLGGSGSTGLGRQLAITRDGSTVIYVGMNLQGQNALYRQRLDATEAALVQGGFNLQSPQVSHDGRWILATGGGTGNRFRVPIEGGERLELRQSIETVYGASSPDGSYWFSASGGLTRFVVGDTAVKLAPSVVGTLVVQQVMDDGRTALMTHKTVGAASGPTVLFDLRTHDTTRVLDDLAREVRYTAGHLVYVKNDATMHAIPFDLKRRRTTGRAVQIASDVSATSGNVVQIAAAANGTVAYVAQEPQSLVFVDRSGASRLATADQRNYHGPQFSPDGRRVAVDFTTAEGRSVWVLGVDDGTLERATFERDSHDATWMPDGKSIFYTSLGGGALTLRRTVPGSTAPAESLFAARELAYTGRWLMGANGGALLTGATSLNSGSGSDIAILKGSGRGPLEPLVASNFIEMYGVASPDGKWLAYVSDKSGRQEVYVRALSANAEDVPVSQRGGTEPIWGPDSRELFYRGEPEGRVTLMLATISTTPRLSVTSRKSLFAVHDVVTANPHANYDLSPDGKTFVLVRRSPATRIIVIQNLPALVKMLSGGGAKE